VSAMQAALQQTGIDARRYWGSNNSSMMWPTGFIDKKHWGDGRVQPILCTSGLQKRNCAHGWQAVLLNIESSQRNTVVQYITCLSFMSHVVVMYNTYNNDLQRQYGEGALRKNCNITL